MLEFIRWFCCCAYLNSPASLASEDDSSTVYFQDIYISSEKMSR